MPRTGIQITLHVGSAPPVRHHFGGDAVTIGRAAGCDLVIPDLELSRTHARLSREADGTWLVADLGSRNGTRLNGSRLDRPAPVDDGDEVVLGAATLVIGLGDRAPGPHEHLPTASPESPARSEPMLVGGSAAIAEIRAAIARMAPTAKTVLITGESGTGKELVAQLLHRRSLRAEGPFVVVNCPALAPSLLEAELFGVEKGVATGVDARPGRLETARGGALFLDEVGDLEPTRG